MTQAVGRRRLLGTVGVGLLATLAGCAAASDDRPPGTVEGGGRCVEGFRVVEEAARVASGRTPEVRLRFVNESDVALTYDARVVFERKTWIGNAVESGVVNLAGSLPAGASVVETARLESDGPGSTGYEVEAAVSCEPP